MLTHEYLNRFNTVLIDTCTVMQPVFIDFLKSIVRQKFRFPRVLLMNWKELQKKNQKEGRRLVLL